MLLLRFEPLQEFAKRGVGGGGGRVWKAIIPSLVPSWFLCKHQTKLEMFVVVRGWHLQGKHGNYIFVIVLEMGKGDFVLPTYPCPERLGFSCRCSWYFNPFFAVDFNSFLPQQINFVVNLLSTQISAWEVGMCESENKMKTSKKKILILDIFFPLFLIKTTKPPKSIPKPVY